jgi:predicted RNA-binding protein with PIN domain
MHYLVDGYNLMRSDPELAMFMRGGATLEVGREAVLRRIEMAAGLKNADSITVVFDGHLSGYDYETRQRRGRLTVIYSKIGETADDVIKRLVQTYATPQVVKVITRDSELRAAAQSADQTSGVMKRRPSHAALKNRSADAEENYKTWNGSTSKKGNARKQPKSAKKKGPGNDVYW